jgi:urea transport system permease protein
LLFMLVIAFLPGGLASLAWRRPKAAAPAPSAQPLPAPSGGN